MFEGILHKLRVTLLLLKAVLSRGLIIDLGKILSEHSIGDLVLDVAAGGSGTGPKILGGSTVALDISVDEIKEAIKNKAKAIWVCADARTMPFRDYVFNWAVTFFGLMFICKKEDKERVLREILRVAKRVILVEPVIKISSGDYLVKVQVLNKGKPLHKVYFGISGEGIKQTPTLIEKIVTSIGASLKCTERKGYFILRIYNSKQ